MHNQMSSLGVGREVKLATVPKSEYAQILGARGKKTIFELNIACWLRFSQLPRQSVGLAIDYSERGIIHRISVDAAMVSSINSEILLSGIVEVTAQAPIDNMDVILTGASNKQFTVDELYAQRVKSLVS